MRVAIATAGCLIGLSASLHAATFNCQFTPPASGSAAACTIESTKVNGCRQPYSATLAAGCRGRLYIDENVLVCYFAVPATIANLDHYLESLKSVTDARSSAPPAGTLAMATELVTASAATDMLLSYADPSGSNYMVLCTTPASP
jgi:hypothetical protein